MLDFSISKSAHLVLKTFPFLLLRAAVYFGIAAAYVVVTTGAAGIGFGIGALAGQTGRTAGAFWGAIGGFAFMTFILWWLREYILYLVKAGHVAALVQFYDERTPPAGHSQIGYAVNVVQQRFIGVSSLLALDRLVQGVVKSLVTLADFPALILPAAPNALRSAINTALQAAAGFVDEVILAYNIRVRASDPWDGAKNGLILYSQNHDKLIKNALLLAGAAYGMAFLVFLIALAPAAAFAYASPGGSSLIAILLAIVFAWSVKQAFIEPFVVASMIQLYFETIDGEKPNASWDTRLTEISPDFRELKTRIGTTPPFKI